MADGNEKLKEWLELLEGLPDELVRASMPACAAGLQAEISADVAAARAPDGEAWKPKQDGGQALTHAAERVTVEAVGTVILAKLTGPEVRHHKGTARGGVRRQILPSRKIPDNVSRVIQRVFAANFRRLTGG